MKNDHSTKLFSLESLPSDDPDFLRELRNRIGEILGDPPEIDLSAEIVDHYKIAKDFRDTLIQNAEDGEEKGAAAAAVSAINAFTNVMVKITELREKSASQEAFRTLLASVVDELGEEDMDLRRRVVARWKDLLVNRSQDK